MTGTGRMTDPFNLRRSQGSRALFIVDYDSRKQALCWAERCNITLLPGMKITVVNGQKEQVSELRPFLPAHKIFLFYIKNTFILPTNALYKACKGGFQRMRRKASFSTTHLIASIIHQ